MRNRRSFLPAIAGAIALAGLGFGLVACSDDEGGSEEDEAAVQASIDGINQAQLTGDVSTIDQYLTDEGAQAIFFGSTIEDIKADPSLVAIESEDEFFVADEIEVDGETATATGGFDDGSVFYSRTVVEFVKEGDDWKANSLGVAAADEPEGAVSVPVSLTEFAFEFDDAELEVGKPVFFEVTNDGEQEHEVIFVKLEEGVVLEEALQEDEPEGVEFLGFAGVYGPDDSAGAAYTANLEAGRYAFVCFLPDTSETNPEEQQPHAFLGMTLEFEVE